MRKPPRPGGAREVHVAPGEDDPHPLARDFHPSLGDRRVAHRTGGLDRDLEDLEEAHRRRHNRVVGYRGYPVHKALDHRKRQVPNESEQPVRNARRVIHGLAKPRLEGAARVRGALGLPGMDPHGRPDRLGRDGRARQQPAPADRAHHQVKAPNLLHELQRGGSRPGDYPRVVVGMDHRGPGLIHNPPRRLLPRPLGRLAEDYPAPVALDGGHLEAAGRPRHDDGGGDPPEPRGPGYRGRMVARRVGRDAPPRLRIRERQDGVRGSAGLEGPGLLEALALEEEARPGELVQSGAGEHGRAADPVADPRMRLLDVSDLDFAHVRPGHGVRASGRHPESWAPRPISQPFSPGLPGTACAPAGRPLPQGSTWYTSTSAIPVAPFAPVTSAV